MTKSSISLVSKWRDLSKAPGMNRVSGSIRLSLFLSLPENDFKGLPIEASPLLELQQRIKGIPQASVSPSRGIATNGTVSTIASTSPSRKKGWERLAAVAAPLSLGGSSVWGSTRGSGMMSTNREAFPLDDSYLPDDTSGLRHDEWVEDGSRRLEGGVEIGKTTIFPFDTAAITAPLDATVTESQLLPESSAVVPQTVIQQIQEETTPGLLDTIQESGGGGEPNDVALENELEFQGGDQDMPANHVVQTDLNTSVPISRPSDQAPREETLAQNMTDTLSGPTGTQPQPLMIPSPQGGPSTHISQPVPSKATFSNAVDTSLRDSSAMTQTSKTYTSKLARMNQASRNTLAAISKFRGTGSSSTTRRRSSTASYMIVDDAAWKTQVLESLAKLERRETQSVAEVELRKLSFDLHPDQVLGLINCIRKMTNAKPLNTRIALLRLLTRLIRDYSSIAIRSMDAIVAFLMDRVHDPESALQDPCIECTSAIAVHLIPLCPLMTADTICNNQEVDFLRLLGPLLSTMSEQSESAQQNAGLCVAALASPSPSTLTLQIQTSCKSLDNVRDMVSQFRNQPHNSNVSFPPAKSLALLSDGRLFIEFPSIADARAFHLSRSVPGGLPSDWSLLEFPKHEATRLEEDKLRYITCLGHFCPRLLHSVLNTMKQRASVRRPLFQAIRNLALMASTQPKEGHRIGKALALAVAPVAERAITCLKERRGGTGHGNERGHWKERAAAAQVVMALAGCYECVPALLELRPALLSTLAPGQSDSIRPVREACSGAAGSLVELSNIVNAATAVASDDSPRPYETSTGDALAAVQGGEPATGEYGNSAPQNMGPGDMDLPDGPPPTESIGSRVLNSPSTKSKTDLDALLEPTVAGNPASTVRILKDLSKGITRSTNTLKKTVEQVSSSS